VLFTYGPTDSTAGKDAIVGWACGGTGTTTPTEINMSAISYPAGYWGYGTGAERAVVQASVSHPAMMPEHLIRSRAAVCGRP
jgi:hypothetical protein